MLDIRRKKVLVIDDFGDFRHSLKKMIESYGVENVDEASNGDAAMVKMEGRSYDIVLCDYNLGDGKKDGQQVLEDAKHRGFLKYSSIFIMVTAENSMGMVMGAIEYQPDDYLVKPFTRAVLMNRLEKQIRRKADLEGIEQAIAKKDYLEAISICNAKLQENSGSRFEYLRLKGELLLNAGLYEEAISHYADIMAIRELPWAASGLGKSYYLSGNYRQAKETFESIINENVTYMEAYDWLAKTLEELDSLKEAQEILLMAAEISPKSILRQKAIGNISYRNQDFDTAEKSYRTVIKMGRNSYLKSPSDYTGLAKTMVEKKCGDEAISVLGAIKAEFKNNDTAALQARIAESFVFKKMDREEDSRKALAEASAVYEAMSGQAPTEIAMELAGACLAAGDTEKGSSIMKEIIRNNHDDEKLIKKIQGVFSDMQMADEGANIINSTRQEIVRINNQGVRLVQEGRLQEAIDYFEKASEGLPDNKIVNANAAQALILFMQKNAPDERCLRLTGQYLARIRRIDPAFSSLPKLYDSYRKLAGAAA